MNSRLLPFLLLSLALTVAPARAQSLVGAWTYGSTASPDSSGTGVFVFLSNGVYFHAESENTADAANGQNGIERGTYNWNSGTGVFTLSSLAVNTNGQWGLSHDPGVGGTVNFSVAGDTLTVDGDATLSRVTGGSSLVGAWTFGNTASPGASGTGVFVFLSNGVYFHIESENSDPNGQNGMERGTYNWNSGTNAFTVNSIAVNTNGEWGLSHDPGAGGTLSFVVSGDALTVDGDAILSRVTAVPEPSTYAAIAGMGALGLALWRRRRVAAAA